MQKARLSLLVSREMEKGTEWSRVPAAEEVYQNMVLAKRCRRKVHNGHVACKVERCRRLNLQRRHHISHHARRERPGTDAIDIALHHRGVPWAFWVDDCCLAGAMKHSRGRRGRNAMQNDGGTCESAGRYWLVLSKEAFRRNFEVPRTAVAAQFLCLPFLPVLTREGTHAKPGLALHLNAS